jgi:hypothetical protein
MWHPDGDLAVRDLPEDLRRLYFGAELLARWFLNTDGMLLVKPSKREDIPAEDRDNKRYAGLVVTTLARIATDLAALEPLVAAAEARLVRARQGRPYRWADNVCTCAHEATLIVARDLLNAVVNACHNQYIMVLLDCNGPPTYDEWLDHYREMLTKHGVLVANDKAGPAWDEFCQRYRACRPSWDSSDLATELRAEAILAADRKQRAGGGASPAGTTVVPGARGAAGTEEWADQEELAEEVVQTGQPDTPPTGPPRDGSGATGAPVGSPAPGTPGRDAPGSEPAGGMPWEEAAQRMERLRAQGEPWTSQHQMGERLGCSSSTINKAINKTPGLQAWAKCQTEASPRAQSLNAVVTDRTAEGREPNPENAAIEADLRRMIEESDPDERAFFHYLRDESRDYQSWYIEQPEGIRKKHAQVWKRHIEADSTARVWFSQQPLEQKLAYLDGADEPQRILGRRA